MDFDLFRLGLKSRLEHPLPGMDAQIKMAPKPVNSRRFEEDAQIKAKLSAVLVLLYPHKGDVCLTLMKRPDYSGVHSGQVSFPGGKKESSDINLIDTALRETEEEIGIHRSKIEVIGELSELFVIASNFKITPVVGVIDYKPQFIPDPIEVAGILNVSLSSLENIDNQGVERMHFRNDIIIHSPYYNVRGNMVWGATAMILSELLEIKNDLG